MEEKKYLFSPQWQDSGSTNELYSGAIALKTYFQSVSTFPISEVTVEGPQKPILENNIFGYQIIERQLASIHAELFRLNADRLGVIGGGCGIEVPIVSYLLTRYPNLHVVWFDAHGDLNSPESSPSKYFHGMPLRFIVEGQDNEIGRRYKKLQPSNVCLVGTRDLDPPESTYIESNRIDVVPITSNYWNDVGSKIRSNVPTYIHLDLDVIDPIVYKNVKCPVAKGLSIVELENTIDYIVQTTKIVGMSIVENIETNQEKITKLVELFKKMIAV